MLNAEDWNVQFADQRRSAVEVPLWLDGIDLPNLPRPQ